MIMYELLVKLNDEIEYRKYTIQELKEIKEILEKLKKPTEEIKLERKKENR